MPKPKPFVLPKQLAQVADLMYTIREERYALQAQVDLLAEKESMCREHIINNLPKSQANGIAGQIARAEIKKKTKPTVKDWKKFWAYVFKTKNSSLVQQRVNDKAVMERWEANEVVPGVDKFTALTISLTKLKD